MLQCNKGWHDNFWRFTYLRQVLNASKDGFLNIQEMLTNDTKQIVISSKELETLERSRKFPGLLNEENIPVDMCGTVE